MVGANYRGKCTLLSNVLSILVIVKFCHILNLFLNPSMVNANLKKRCTLILEDLNNLFLYHIIQMCLISSRQLWSILTIGNNQINVVNLSIFLIALKVRVDWVAKDHALKPSYDAIDATLKCLQLYFNW
jgi:hypothetical protein